MSSAFSTLSGTLGPRSEGARGVGADIEAGLGLIVARMDPPPELEDEFNDWYDGEHIAERLRVPGFLKARRVQRRERPRYAAMYDLESMAVLETEAYKNVTGQRRSAWTARMLRQTRSFDRRVYEQSWPGRVGFDDAQPWTALRVLAPSVTRDSVLAHARAVGAEDSASARVYIGREKAEGEQLVLYGAADEVTLEHAIALGDALGGSVDRYGAYAREAEESELFTNIPAGARAASDAFYRRGYTDGLPIVPPTDELVAEMIATQPKKAGEVLGLMPPRQGETSIEALAINAVMAGCRPEYFPVVIAATEALLDPRYNLLGVQATTHPVTPLLIINGPIRYELGFNLSGNAMGEGTQANATIGRAIRLVLRNIGGGRPGKTDFTTQGSPARYGFCVAENEEQSPFSPLHVALGFAATDSVVTVCQAEGPHNVNDHSSQTALALMHMIAGTMATFGTNDLARGGHPTLALGPEHAKLLAREAWTREKIQAWLWEHARVSLGAMPADMQAWLKAREDIDKSVWIDDRIPIGNTPADFLVFVAGGTGRHSSYMPSFGFGRPATRKIDYTPTGAPPPLIPDCDC